MNTLLEKCYCQFCSSDAALQPLTCRIRPVQPTEDFRCTVPASLARTPFMIPATPSLLFTVYILQDNLFVPAGCSRSCTVQQNCLVTVHMLLDTFQPAACFSSAFSVCTTACKTVVQGKVLRTATQWSHMFIQEWSAGPPTRDVAKQCGMQCDV